MIREATPEDAALVAEDFWYPLAEAMEPYSELNELTDDALAHAREGFADLLGREDRYEFLLEIEGEPVGYIDAEMDTRPTRNLGAYMDIINLHVREGYRDQGYGTRLVEKVEAVAEREGCDYVTVSAEWANDPANDLYESLGYEPKQVKHAKRLR